VNNNRVLYIPTLTGDNSSEIWTIKGDVYREFLYFIFHFYYSFDHWAFEFVDRDRKSYNVLFMEDIWKEHFIHCNLKSQCTNQLDIKKNILDKKEEDKKELHLTSDPFAPANIVMKEAK
jgi:hypothetical protein